METNIKIVAAAIGGLVLGAGLSGGIGMAPGVLHAQGTTPYYEVAEINVTDQPTYEASGVKELRDTIMNSGAKLLAGGYNKTQSYDGAPIANRYLIFMYPSKEAHDKLYKSDLRPWSEKVKGKSASTFRIIGVEAVEMK
jgi:uncharacterized protein (DUF1330 family)